MKTMKFHMMELLTCNYSNACQHSYIPNFLSLFFLHQKKFTVCDLLLELSWVNDQIKSTGDTNIVHYNFFGLQVEFYFTVIYLYIFFSNFCTL